MVTVMTNVLNETVFHIPTESNQTRNVSFSNLLTPQTTQLLVEFFNQSIVSTTRPSTLLPRAVTDTHDDDDGHDHDHHHDLQSQIYMLRTIIVLMLLLALILLLWIVWMKRQLKRQQRHPHPTQNASHAIYDDDDDNWAPNTRDKVP
jgi:hypothetical protein